MVGNYFWSIQSKLTHWHFYSSHIDISYKLTQTSLWTVPLHQRWKGFYLRARFFFPWVTFPSLGLRHSLSLSDLLCCTLNCASTNTFLLLHRAAHKLTPGTVENLSHYAAFLRNEPLLLVVPGFEISNCTGQDTWLTDSKCASDIHSKF